MGMQCPPSPRSWIERHKAEGFSAGRVDDLRNVDAHAITHHGHFVHEADIDHSEGVFEKLHHLGDGGAADGDNVVEGLRIEQGTHFGAGGGDATYDFGDVAGLVMRIAGVDALGREAQEEIFTGLEAPLFKHGQQKFFSGTGICGGFQDEEHPWVKVFRHLFRGGDHIAHVGVPCFAEWRWDSDVDRVQLGDDREVCGRAQLARVDVFPNEIAGDILNVGTASVVARRPWRAGRL